MNKHKIFFFVYNKKNKNLKFYKKSSFRKIKNRKLNFFVIGNPKVDNQVFFSKFKKKNEYIKKIDGEFLLIVKSKKKISIINDRFTSIPLYYVIIKDDIFFSNNYTYLFKRIKSKTFIKLIPENFIEFLNFRKLHGNKTFDNKIKFLDYSSKLEISSKKIYINRYWFPKFDDKYKSKNLDYISNLFIKKTLNSISNKIGNNKNVKLFLSGGLDTRFILAALIKLNLNIECFTFGYSIKSEYFYSRLLTRINKIKHHFLKIDQNEIIKNSLMKLRLSGGMYNHFINFFIRS